MRVIAGKYRGRNLKSPPSLEVRPTSDRLRETLFNIIAPRIEDAQFLDLCAGSGAVGIEALSRASCHVTFVERSRKMCDLIRSNLDLCQIESALYTVIQSEALSYLRGTSLKSQKASGDPSKQSSRWDIVFFDPPYAADYGPVLDIFSANSSTLLSQKGLLIVEHHHKNKLKETAGRIIRTRLLKQGDSALSFYQPVEESLDLA